MLYINLLSGPSYAACLSFVLASKGKHSYLYKILYSVLKHACNIADLLTILSHAADITLHYMTSTASLVWVQLYEAKPPPQEVCMWPSGLVKALGWIVYLLWLQAVYLHYKPKTWTLGLRQKFLQRFFFFFFSPNNTREFKAKRVAEQISHIPGSPA